MFKGQRESRDGRNKELYGKESYILPLKWTSSLLILSYVWGWQVLNSSSGKVLHDSDIYKDSVFPFENGSEYVFKQTWRG